MRCLRICLTVGNTETQLVASASRVKMSSAIYVPDLPTPALKQSLEIKRLL